MKKEIATNKAVNNKLCGVCDLNHRRTAIVVHEVSICYDCLIYFQHIAKIENKSNYDVVEESITYMLSQKNERIK